MPPTLTPDEVLKIAALANLKLEPEEIALFARQLGDVLAYADEVLKVDTAGVPPTASVRQSENGATADREDTVHASLEIHDTLSNAPDADHSLLHGGFFKVPRVIG